MDAKPIHLRLGVRARLGADVGGLHHHVRLVVAAATIHRADDGELVHQRGLLGQMLAQVNARQLRGNGLERPAIAGRRVGLRVPHVHMAGTAGHPEEDDGLVAAHRAAGGGGLRPDAKEIWQRQPAEAREAGLEHRAAAGDVQPLAHARVQRGERVAVRAGVGEISGHGANVERPTRRVKGEFSAVAAKVRRRIRCSTNSAS